MGIFHKFNCKDYNRIVYKIWKATLDSFIIFTFSVFIISFQFAYRFSTLT